jgi:hypothetical protein
MENLTESEAILQEFIFPFLQLPTTATIGSIAYKQEKWSRANLSERFLERLSKLAISHAELARLTSRTSQTEWEYQYKDFKALLLESKLASRLYKREESMAKIETICKQSIDSMYLVIYPVGPISAHDYAKNIALVIEYNEKLYEAIGDEYDVENVLKNV